eukprot:gene9933-2115_t
MPPHLRLDSGLMDIFKRHKSVEDRVDALQKFTPRKGTIVKCSTATSQELITLLEKSGSARTAVLIVLKKSMETPAHRYGLSNFVPAILQGLGAAIQTEDTIMDSDAEMMIQICEKAWSRPAAVTKVIKVLFIMVTAFVKCAISYRNAMKAAQLANDLVESSESTIRKALSRSMTEKIIVGHLLFVPDIGDFDLQLELVQLVFSCSSLETFRSAVTQAENNIGKDALLQHFARVRMSHFEEDCTRALMQINLSVQSVVSKEVSKLWLDQCFSDWHFSELDPTLPRLAHFNLGSKTISFQIAEGEVNITIAIDSSYVSSFTVSKDTLAINLDLNKGKHYKFRQISIQFTDSLMVQRAAVQTLGVQKQELLRTRASVTTPIRIIRPTSSTALQQTSSVSGRSNTSTSVSKSEGIGSHNDSQIIAGYHHQSVCDNNTNSADINQDSAVNSSRNGGRAQIHTSGALASTNTFQKGEEEEEEEEEGEEGEEEEDVEDEDAGDEGEENIKTKEHLQEIQTSAGSDSDGDFISVAQAAIAELEAAERQSNLSNQHAKLELRRKLTSKRSVVNTSKSNSNADLSKDVDCCSIKSRKHFADKSTEQGKGRPSTSSYKEQLLSRDADHLSSARSKNQSENCQENCRSNQTLSRPIKKSTAKRSSNDRTNRKSSKENKQPSTVSNTSHHNKTKTPSQDSENVESENSVCWDDSNNNNDGNLLKRSKQISQKKDKQHSSPTKAAQFRKDLNHHKQQQKQVKASKRTFNGEYENLGKHSEKMTTIQQEGSETQQNPFETPTNRHKQLMIELEKQLLSKQRELKELTNTLKLSKSKQAATMNETYSGNTTPRFKPLPIVTTPRSEAPKAVAVLFPDEQDTIEEEISQDVVELSGPEDNDQEGSLIKLLEAAAGGKSKAQMTSFAAKEPQSGVCPTGRYQQNTQTHPKLTSDRMNINQNALSSITPTNVEVSHGSGVEDAIPTATSWQPVYSSLDFFENELQNVLTGLSGRLKLLRKSRANLLASHKSALKGAHHKYSKLQTLLKGNHLIVNEAARETERRRTKNNETLSTVQELMTVQLKSLQDAVSTQIRGIGTKAFAEVVGHYP